MPLVNELEWICAFGVLPLWSPADEPLLIVAPHPDDETLGAGGLIAAMRQRGVDVTVAAVTDGENAYPHSPGLAQLRRAEQDNALARLGVARNRIHRFQLPDSGLQSHQKELVERLTPLISKGTHVVAPWQGDFHPDHEACGRAAKRIARQAGARLTSYFFWTWHRGDPSLLSDLQLRSFPLNDELMRAKGDALLCHRSQLAHPGGEPILPDTLLAPARRTFEVFAAA